MVIGGDRPEFRKSWPDRLCKLLSAAWHADHTKRPAASEVVAVLKIVEAELSAKEQRRPSHEAAPAATPGGGLRRRQPPPLLDAGVVDRAPHRSQPHAAAERQQHQEWAGEREQQQQERGRTRSPDSAVVLVRLLPGAPGADEEEEERVAARAATQGVLDLLPHPVDGEAKIVQVAVGSQDVFCFFCFGADATGGGGRVRARRSGGWVGRTQRRRRQPL